MRRKPAGNAETDDAAAAPPQGLMERAQETAFGIPTNDDDARTGSYTGLEIQPDNSDNGTGLHRQSG